MQTNTLPPGDGWTEEVHKEHPQANRSRPTAIDSHTPAVENVARGWLGEPPPTSQARAEALRHRRPHRKTDRRAGADVVVAHGYGLKVRVERRHLIVEDGFGRQRRTRRFHRTGKLRRLVLIGRSGYVTLDSLRWLQDTGAAFVHVDASGELIAASITSGVDLAGLRRAQALAQDSPAGLEVARHVLAEKIRGQRAVLDELPSLESARNALDSAGSEIEGGRSMRTLLTAERDAAKLYWEVWSALPARFPPRDAARLPEHWRTFGQRASLITGGPRTATNPANAILNYLYALLEAETIFACHALGLDPGLGVFHTDREGRASLALDLMEAARPAVDAYVLAMLTQRTLSAREFVETREGGCRITPRLAEQLAETCAVWRSHVAPVVEWTANTLARHARSRVPTRAPLTRAHHRAALDERLPSRKSRRAPVKASLPPSCRGCGKPLTDGRRPYCQDCRRARWIEQASRSRRTAADMTGELRDGLAEQLHSAILASPGGMTRTQIQRLLSRNVPGDRIQAALDQLAESGRARRQHVATGGRPAERWIVPRARPDSDAPPNP
jgi:CRISPR-associated endonuclease Cas1